jgi:hypothetical protein
MAVVITTTKSAISSASGTTATGTHSGGVGQNILLGINWNPTGNQTPTLNSVTDNLGGTWVAVGSTLSAPATTATGNILQKWFYRTTQFTTITSVTVTATFSASTASTGAIFSATGVTSTPTTVLSTVSTGATTGTVNVGTIATGDGAVGLLMAYGTGSPTPPASNTVVGTFTTMQTALTLGTTVSGRAIYEPTAGSATAGPGTFTGTVTGNIVSVVYLSGAVASSPTTGSGSITLSGTASVILKYPITATGQVSIAGTLTNDGKVDFPRTASGAVSLVATAADVLKFTRTGSASITLTATATPQLKFTRTGSAAIGLSASASPILKFTITGSGSLSLGATANSQLNFPTSASGGLAMNAGADAVLYSYFIGWGIGI